MAFERNSDGSTSRIFLNTSYLHGFEVLDFAERKVTATIKLPTKVADNPSKRRFLTRMGVTQTTRRFG